MASDPYINGDADEMSKRVTLSGPKTEYQKAKDSEVNVGDKMAAHWMDQIDSMDPNIS